MFPKFRGRAKNIARTSGVPGLNQGWLLPRRNCKRPKADIFGAGTKNAHTYNVLGGAPALSQNPIHMGGLQAATPDPQIFCRPVGLPI